MAVYSFRTSNYAYNIFISGMQRFTARDGFTGIPAEYHEPVKQFAAKNYTVPPYASAENRSTQLDVGLNNEWITQQEYDETGSYIVPIETTQ
ncbi:hypothetical protein [Brevibacillus centrosporus]|uniref:hypothetical protein n=1 Tax=Brevibacillus centrosporus TaxID=54910 RepID=UPI002E1F241E|nr:hypothetical protein [Brevibacillus centrosporus]